MLRLKDLYELIKKQESIDLISNRGNKYCVRIVKPKLLENIKKYSSIVIGHDKCDDIEFLTLFFRRGKKEVINVVEDFKI